MAEKRLSKQERKHILQQRKSKKQREDNMWEQLKGINK
jgi:hypothetical protein